ncbi:MAG TPA: cytochrome b N-terminal domain-containing protein [Anaerolineae bacterium]|nr:cytochrome b N-terminal domain-containing protein [Anaerolineae bacterium]
MPLRRPNFFYHLHPPTIPEREARFRYTFGLGGISVLLFLVLAVTGLVLTFFYIPTPLDAFASLEIIAFQAPFGWLMRNLHYWAAQAAVIVVALHMLRVIFTGAYKPPRRANYLIGLALLAGTLLLDFTGYVLRWDEGTQWALLVGTNLVKETPLIGEALYRTLVGGSEIGAATTIRFYAWHILGLAVPAVVLIGWHIFKVRRDGGIAHPPREGDPPPRIDRARLVRTETIAMLIVLAALLALSVLFPAPLGPTVDLPTRADKAQAPWFFLWVQALLRAISPVWAGVLIPLGLLSILALIPYAIDRKAEGVAEWFNRPGRAAQVITIMIFLGLIALTLVELGM